MATVFLAAVDGRAGVHRFVALKCLKPELARQPSFAAMFLDEARISSQIHHPNVCSVIDFDEANGVSYMALEYLAGEPLSSVRVRLAAELAELDPAHHAAMVARIVADASEGLHAAHELVDASGAPSNVVHRDISPDNLMLTYDGCVKLLDFGVSTSVQNSQHTRSGVVKGKFSYLAPEVLQGRRPDRRSDVWGLGVVAWELLTGQRLFEGTTDIETLRAIADRPIPAPSRLRRGVPVAMDRIVLRALERDPDMRHVTARELGRELNQFLANRRVAFGLPELAEAMDRLFPNGRIAKRQLLTVVEQIEESVVALATSEIMVEQRTPAPPHEGSAPGAVARRLRAGLSHLGTRLRRRRRTLAVLTGAVATSLLITGWSFRRAPADPVSPASAAPAAPPRADLPFAVNVSNVEAVGDTLVLRLELVPSH